MAEISPLRRRMIEDMTIRNLSPATQQSYIYAVAKFSRHFNRSPDRLGLEEVRAYQLHLIARAALVVAYQPDRLCACASSTASRLGRSDAHEQIVAAREPQRLPEVLERRGDRAVPRGGSRSAQPRGADHGLWRGPARRRSRPLADGGHRQQPDADPHRAGQGRQGPLRHALAPAAADPAHLLAAGPAGPVAVPGS